METLHFVDGYHGGIEGHMPLGSWRDILDCLARIPEWAISLDVEPSSWEYLRITDPDAYNRVRAFFESEGDYGRVEILNGSFSQPFCWAINGESNVRQLTRGLAILAQHFPFAAVDTYAVQEPCFTSSIVQIAARLGFKRMSLKNSTNWGGYMAKMDGSIINLKSHDGSSLPTVVRYNCEELYGCCATTASGYDRKAIRTFADTCVRNGISAPLGFCLQDLGWLSKPHVRDIPIEYTTYRRYFRDFGELADGERLLTQDDVLCALPWGNPCLSRITGDVRALENRLLRTEKLLAVCAGEAALPQSLYSSLDRAWSDVLRAQHHDAYICGASPRWQQRSVELTGDAARELDKVDLRAEFIAAGSCAPDNDGNCIYLRVYGTTGTERNDCAETELSLPRGWTSLRVLDSHGLEVPSQFRSNLAHSFGYDENDVLLPSVPDDERLYSDGSLNAVTLQFSATTSGLGYSSYTVVPSDRPAAKKKILTRTSGHLTADTGAIRAVFDLRAGGCITSCIDLETGIDCAAGQPFGYLRGFFPNDGVFFSSLTTAADVRIIDNGPALARFAVYVPVGSLNTQIVYTLRANERRIDAYASVTATKPERIGYPYMPPDETFNSSPIRSCYKERYKLAVVMPLHMKDYRVFKGAPYDICESSSHNTDFDSWRDIKHSIINPYIDFCSDDGLGFAVHCDRVNGYCITKDEFTLTVAFGYHTGFFWGNPPFTGTATLGYSIFPHTGDTFAAHTAAEFQKREEPLIVSRLPGRPAVADRTLLESPDPALLLVTVNGRETRLFNASPSAVPLGGLPGLMADLNAQSTGERRAAAPFEIVTLVPEE